MHRGFGLAIAHRRGELPKTAPPFAQGACTLLWCPPVFRVVVCNPVQGFANLTCGLFIPSNDVSGIEVLGLMRQPPGCGTQMIAPVRRTSRITRVVRQIRRRLYEKTSARLSGPGSLVSRFGRWIFCADRLVRWNLDRSRMGRGPVVARFGLDGTTPTEQTIDESL
jgi:hypothetical protein